MAEIPREDKKDFALNVRISADEKTEWQTLADKHGVSISRFVRFAVNDFCKREKKSKK